MSWPRGRTSKTTISTAGPSADQHAGRSACVQVNNTYAIRKSNNTRHSLIAIIGKVIVTRSNHHHHHRTTTTTTTTTTTKHNNRPRTNRMHESSGLLVCPSRKTLPTRKSIFSTRFDPRRARKHGFQAKLCLDRFRYRLGSASQSMPWMFLQVRIEL